MKDRKFNLLDAFTWGLLIGFAGVWIYWSENLPAHFPSARLELKDACEANLPRNQHCVIQYVPEDK